MNIYGYADHRDLESISRLKGFGIREEFLIIENQPYPKDLPKRFAGCDQNDLIVFGSLDSLGDDFFEIHQCWTYLIFEKLVEIKVLDMPLWDTKQLHSRSDRIVVLELIEQFLLFAAKKEQKDSIKRQLNHHAQEIRKESRPGRKLIDYPDHWEQIYHDWQSGEITAKTAMNQANLKYATFYNLVKRYERQFQIERKRVHGKDISN